nr:acyl-CoA dehydrogenase family protein [Streptomyces griseoviridis]
MTLWDEVSRVSARHVEPRVARMEAASRKVERKLPQIFGGRRWFGVTIPTEYGGLGAGHVAKTVLIHRLAMASGAAAAILQAGLIPVGAMQLWGTTAQKARWLPQAADGTVLMTIAVTEPEAGGHIGGIETAAERDGDEWVITGEKTHIGNSCLAHLHLVVARTAAPGTRPSEGLTMFLVEHDRPGVSATQPRPRLGLHGFSAGHLTLDRVRVPAENTLGAVGEGLFVAQSSSILYGRPNLAALSLGLHEAVVTTTAEWLSSRPRYGGHLSDLGVVRDRLGQMQARLVQARTLAYHAVHRLDNGHSCDADLISAKYAGHELAAASGRDAMELHGARGLDVDYPLQRLWRDIQHTYPPAGTGEIQRLHLARTSLGTTPIEWSERLAAETSWTRDPVAV